MILECIEDLYWKDEKGKLTNERGFTKGKLYQVEEIHNKEQLYRVYSDDDELYFIEMNDKKFKVYENGIYIIIYKTKGSILVRADSAKEAINKINLLEGEFTITKVDFEVTEEGKLLKYKNIY